MFSREQSHIPKLWAYVNHGVLVNKIWPVHKQAKDAKKHQQISLTSFKCRHFCFNVRGAYIPLWLPKTPIVGTC